ncbi:GAF domain-containing protein [Spinactinospora alkalitolerans]|uniref:GAF domain-containing protein n=1 Tax=Spinactinospora alkalitolerans TaxID=687207 RepID=A0A852U0K6_9ACTN|nr:GAF and ANTAR domain-containing protein [Spinactinospora alkalitolerans]NYE50366.1 GAF domain-containing protein [Spinactinospora alkalitolerans]
MVAAPAPGGADDRIALVRRLVSLTEELGSSPGLEEAAQRIVDAMVGDLDLCDHAHVTARTGKNGPWITAHSDGVAKRLGDSYVFLGTSPKLHITLADPLTRTATEHSDGRWTRFLTRAAAHDVRSMYAARLTTSKRRIGVLTLYSDSPDAFEEQGTALLATVTDHVAITLQHKIEVANLTRALSTRSLIGSALGILMERHSIAEEEAWKIISRTSQELNIRLVDICRRVVADTEAAASPEEPSSSEKSPPREEAEGSG